MGLVLPAFPEGCGDFADAPFHVFDLKIVQMATGRAEALVQAVMGKQEDEAVPQLFVEGQVAYREIGLSIYWKHLLELLG